jgi:hypothetical protein
VPKNAIFTREGPVLVDWTAAGCGLRLVAMALVLRSSWAARPFLRGYTRHVELTEEERERLSGLLLSRQLIDLALSFCRDPESVNAGRIPALQRESADRAQDRFRSAGPNG